jgi:hypothetical protein
MDSLGSLVLVLGGLYFSSDLVGFLIISIFSESISFNKLLLKGYSEL